MKHLFFKLQKFTLLFVLSSILIFIPACTDDPVILHPQETRVDVETLANDQDFGQLIDLIQAPSFDDPRRFEKSLAPLTEKIKSTYLLDQLSESEVAKLVTQAYQKRSELQKGNPAFSIEGDEPELAPDPCEILCALAYMACVLSGADYCYPNYLSCLFICRTGIDPPF